MGVRSFRCHVLNDRVEYGESVRLRLEFEAESKLEVGLALVSFSSVAGTFDAQSEFTQELRTIPAGESSLEFEVGPLYLRKRSYYVSLSIHDPIQETHIISMQLGSRISTSTGPWASAYRTRSPRRGIESKNGQPLASRGLFRQGLTSALSTLYRHGYGPSQRTVAPMTIIRSLLNWNPVNETSGNSEVVRRGCACLDTARRHRWRPRYLGRDVRLCPGLDFGPGCRSDRVGTKPFPA